MTTELEMCGSRYFEVANRVSPFFTKDPQKLATTSAFAPFSHTTTVPIYYPV